MLYSNAISFRTLDGACFIRGCTFPLNLALNYLIETMSSFFKVMDHTRAIERACIKTYEGDGTRQWHKYKSIGIFTQSEDPLERGQLHLQPSNSTPVAFSTLGGSQVRCCDHRGQSSHHTLWSIWYGNLGHGIHSGLVGVEYQGITRDFYGCGKIGHLHREFT